MSQKEYDQKFEEIFKKNGIDAYTEGSKGWMWVPDSKAKYGLPKKEQP